MTRKYLTKEQVKALQQTGELLTKQQVIDKINKDAGYVVIDGKSTVVKFIDYRGNSQAPESFAYYVSYNHAFLSNREICVYWPFTVGMQG